jgi:hypothetical protein
MVAVLEDGLVMLYSYILQMPVINVKFMHPRFRNGRKGIF